MYSGIPSVALSQDGLGWMQKTRSMYEMSPSRIEIRLISDTETDFFPGQLETEKRTKLNEKDSFGSCRCFY